MATLHENKDAWYFAQCEVTSDGKYTFQFDYDRLPAFSIIPSPGKWLDEFSKYPRPELKASIQDWLDGKVEANEIVQRLKQMRLSNSLKMMESVGGKLAFRFYERYGLLAQEN